MCDARRWISALLRASLFTAVALSSAIELSAQGRGGGGMNQGGMGGMGGEMMGSGMMGPETMEMMGQGVGMMATGGPSSTMILRMGNVLELTAAQRERLEAIQSEEQGSLEPHMSALREAHERATAAVASDPPDFAAYEAALQQAADHMVQAHLVIAQGAADARAVLTPTQLDRLETGSRMMQMMEMR